MEQEKDTAGELKKWIISFVVSVAAAIIVVTVFAVTTKDEAKEGKQAADKAAVTNKALIDAIVKSCEDNGNPLREVVQEGLREQVEQSSDHTLFEELFPGADPEKLDRLIEAQVRELNKRLKKIEPLNCQDQYPDHK